MNKYLSLLSIVLASTLISTSNASSLINPKSSLFNKVKRQTTGTSQNGMPYPAPGGDPPSQDTLPQSWIDAYNKAKSEGKIPDIKPSTAPGGIVEYPADQDMTNVCSWTTQKCDTGDIWLAPPGKAGLSFDDGPNLGTEELLKYLDENDLSGTHFVIGSAILYNPDTMKLMADSGVHLGVHTFSHSIQTTKTDLEVLGDLGWNMQLIYEATGKVPMYFRPPEGDVDNRVRAIARDVLGLQTVMWNEDADDWCLRQGSGTAQLQTCLTGTGKDYQSVVNEMKSWADNDKSSGFISLEHETTDQAVNAFKEYATELKNKGWNVTEIPGLQDLPWYQNQFGKDDPVTQVDSILPTIPAINIVDSAAAPGTSGAPDASAFRSGNGGGGSSSSSSSSVGSSTSASSTSKSASQTSSTTTRATNPTSNNNNNDTSGAVALSSFNLVALGVASFVASYLL